MYGPYHPVQWNDASAPWDLLGLLETSAAPDAMGGHTWVPACVGVWVASLSPRPGLHAKEEKPHLGMSYWPWGRGCLGAAQELCLPGPP